MADKITPVFVTGAGHSGTTILYNMLAMHPDITWFSLFSQRQVDERYRMLHYPLMLYDRILRSLFNFDWKKEASWHRRRYVLPRPVEGDHVWNYMMPEDKSISQDESVRRMRRIFNEECCFWRKSVILLKLPRLFSEISTLRRAFPNEKFIHIVRDGRAVAKSMSFKFIRSCESEREALHSAAKYWVSAVTSVNEEKERIDIMEFRYEDFCSDVHSRLSDILSFIQVNSNRFPLHRCPKSLGVSNPLRLESMRGEEIELVERVQGSYLRMYGYLEK